ncbi:hypothetical protein GNQ08_20620 [Paenibacillus macerans]|uniref:Phage protein Gp138 N-terminal domain-containing protein n=1 Tax=Paenibacillus macerans TaxID=44252 RepID=A0A6N8EX56_PAEMA|nr:Gp138 family membrane-puncturing spike protein [Paenibacillus macerans]MUG24776.1 hypothetical protein [Paenibacillus macerans]
MKNDPAGALANLLQTIADKIGGDIHVGFPAKVVSFDESAMMADVQPLIRTGSDEPAVVQGARVLGQRLKLASGGSEQEYVPVFKKDDLVYVSIADSEIKNALTGAVAKPDTSRQHDMNDAVIVGILPSSFK